ncbi:hypothetical protein SUGI_0536260 [Cryptomeria japonica]|nr:hypothetical protein SUGI_0536260 [Cryptomeria japonica]
MGSAEEIRDEGFLETLFRRFDGNGDEKLCREEMNLLTKTLGVKLTKEEIDCLMDCTDEDRDGCLNFTEFVKMYRFLMSCAGNGFKDVNNTQIFRKSPEKSILRSLRRWLQISHYSNHSALDL